MADTMEPLSPELSLGLEELQTELEKLKSFAEYVEVVKQRSTRAIEGAVGVIEATKVVANQGDALVQLGGKLLDRLEGAGVVTEVERLSRTIGELRFTVDAAHGEVRQYAGQVEQWLRGSVEVAEKVAASAETASRASDGVAAAVERLRLDDAVLTLCSMEQRLGTFDVTVKQIHADLQQRMDATTASVLTGTEAGQVALERAADIAASSQQLVNSLERSTVAVQASAASKLEALSLLGAQLEGWSSAASAAAQDAASSAAQAARLGEKVLAAAEGLRVPDTVDAVGQLLKHVDALEVTVQRVNDDLKGRVDATNDCIRSGVGAVEASAERVKSIVDDSRQLTVEVGLFRKFIEESDIPGRMDRLAEALKAQNVEFDVSAGKRHASIESRIASLETKVESVERTVKSELERLVQAMNQQSETTRRVQYVSLVIGGVILAMLVIHLLH